MHASWPCRVRSTTRTKTSTNRSSWPRSAKPRNVCRAWCRGDGILTPPFGSTFTGDQSHLGEFIMQIWNYIFPVVLCCTLVLAAACAAQEHHPEHNWDYGESQGPNHWGELNPEFALCQNGHHQSPIDIRNPRKADLPPIQFDYKPSPLHIIDNGHTVMINYGPGSSITVGGEKYALKQFHFHRPSEERINGVAYEIGVHLVHADQQGH